MNRFGEDKRLELIPLETAPRYAIGVDHGIDGIILARKEDNSVRLVWRSGYPSWAGVGMGQSYNPSSLTLFHPDDETRQFSYLGETLEEGGRLSRDRITRHDVLISGAVDYRQMSFWLMHQSKGLPTQTLIVHNRPTGEQK